MTTTTVRPRRTLTDPLLALVVAVAVVALAGRFVGLATSPPGFFVDEAIVGAQLVCLRFTGADATGVSWPLMSSVVAGHNPFWLPLWVYPGVGWVRVFGGSIASLRGFEVALSVIGVVATAGVARNFLGRRAFAWVLLIGALSPWGWTLGRVAFGNSAITGVAFLMSGLWLVSRGTFQRPLRWFEAGGGALLLGSAILVNHTRVPALIVSVLVAAVFVRRRLVDREMVVGTSVGLLLVVVPLMASWDRVNLWSRAQQTSVLSDPDLPSGGVGRVVGVIGAVLGNGLEHLHPRFLFVSGDPNLRHSTQIVGQLGWLEILLLVATPLAVILVRRGVVTVAVQRIYFVLVAAGIVGTLISVSLTGDELPHALRTFPAQPFLALGLGVTAMVLTERWRLVPVVAVLVSVLFAAFFVPRYFGEYREAAAFEFEVGLVAAAQEAGATGQADAFIAASDPGLRRVAAIYLTSDGAGNTCPGPRPD